MNKKLMRLEYIETKKIMFLITAIIMYQISKNILDKKLDI